MSVRLPLVRVASRNLHPLPRALPSLLFVLTIMVGLAAGPARAAPPDPVQDWNALALDAVRSGKISPPEATRALAMTHLALWLGTAPGVPSSLVMPAAQGIGDLRPAAIRTSREAAACTAAHDVGRALFPAHAARCDELLAAELATIPDGTAKERGIAFGHAVAATVARWREDDHAGDVVPYDPLLEPGFWRPTPPAFAPALLPHWGAVTPFVLRDAQAYRAPAPPALASAAYAAAFEEVKRLGAKDSAERTPEQTEIALFWADGGGTATPPGHWNEIAAQLAERVGMPLEERARLMAALNMMLADVAIVTWDTKYTYGLWRPVTAIREAADDGNPATDPDAEWLSLIGTPPFPAYTSGHSTFSAAAAELLALWLGGDDVTFEVTSEGLPGVTRTYGALSEAAAEAGASRIYGGIHYDFDNTAGQATGRAIARRVHALFNP